MKKNNEFFTKDEFLTAIRNYVEYNKRPYRNVFILKHTPLIYQSLGYDDLEVKLPVSVVNKAIYGKHKDEMNKSQFFEVLSEFFNPLLILKSKQIDRAKVSLSSIVATDTEIFGTILLTNEERKYSKQHIITSVHKRRIIANDKTNILVKEYNKGNLEYINLEKLEMLEKKQLSNRLAGSIAALHRSIANNSITENERVVNRKNEKTFAVSQNHQFANSVISPSTIRDQISDFKNNTFNRTDTFTITTLNPLLKQIGYTNDEITLDQTHMRYCLFNSYKGNDNEKANHFTGEEFFEKLPELLSSPIAIIPSNTKGDERQLIILDNKLNGSYVCLSTRADGQGKRNFINFPSTHIFSICAKEQTEYILQCRINEEIEHQKYANKPLGIYYIDNKKATEMLNSKGFELPRAFNLNGHINNIPNINTSVNTKKENFMEKSDLNSYLNKKVAGMARESKRLSQEIANYERHKTSGLRFYDTFTLASNNNLLKQVGYTNSEFVLDLTHFRYCTEKNAYYNLKLKEHKNTYNLDYETKSFILKALQKDNDNHFVGIEFLYKVPELLTHPIAIFAEKNHPDRQAIMLDYKHNDSYVMLAVKPNGQKKVNNINYPAIFVHSIYANEKVEYKLSRQIMNEGSKFINNTNNENNFVFYLDSKRATDVINEAYKKGKLRNSIYNETKKAIKVLDSENTQASSRASNLNGHINNIPNIERVVNMKNEKNEETYKNIDFSSELNLSFDEFALTNTIATLLNKVGINTYVIPKDELTNLVEQKVKATTSDETLIYKTLSDYEVYGCTKGKNIYLEEGAIKSDVLLHEYAHLWIETFRLSNPNEWDKIKTSLMNDKEVVNSLNRYSSILSPNTDDGKLVEYICDKIAENGKDLTFEKILSEDLSTIFECATSDELLKNISKCAIKDLVNSSPILKNANIPENVIFFDSKDKTPFDDDNETLEEQDADNSLLDEKLKTDEYHFTPKRDEVLEMVLFGSNSDNTASNGDEHIVLDYSTVESDKILLANKTTILDKPYPSYLPPLHYELADVNDRKEKLFKIPATELKDGNYLIKDIYIDNYIDEDGEKHYKSHTIYYKVSLDVYAALKHYNTTFFRAIEEKRVSDNLKEINSAIDKENAKNPNLELSHLQKGKYQGKYQSGVFYYVTYNPNILDYNTIPKIKVSSLPYKYSFKGKHEIYYGSTLKEHQTLLYPVFDTDNLYSHTVIINRGAFINNTIGHTVSDCLVPDDILTARKVIDRQKKHSMAKSTYDEIKDTSKKIYNTELENPEIFRQWINLQEKVACLLNDMYYQEDNLMSSFQKGRETSYGDSNTQSTLLDDYGVLIKRQNGDAINEKETSELKNALDYTFSLYGNLSPILKENNIKLSHAGNVNQHASSAIGIWHPLYKAIGISFKNDEQAFSTSVHEFAHFLDYIKGQKTHHWHNSTIYGTIENTIANTFRDKTHPPTKYYSSTPECFARCMQLYAASLKFFDNRKIDLNSIEDLEYREIEALNEDFLKENPNFDNFEISGDLQIICTKVNDYEPPISLFKVCSNFINETRELLNVEEYKVKPIMDEKIANSQNHQFTNSVISPSTIQDQISAFKNNTFNRTDTFTIATLNPLLKEIGYTNDEITLDQTHMRYCLFNSYKGNDNEKANHFTGEEFFDKLPELLSSPIAIIPSNTKGDERQLIILDYKLNGSYVCMSVRADGQGMRNNKAFSSTHILSLYAKDTAEYILHKEIENEVEHQNYENKPCGIYYIDNKKATEMLNGKGFQLPRSFNLNGHINNIPNINTSVNRKNEKSEKTFAASQNHRLTNSVISSDETPNYEIQAPVRDENINSRKTLTPSAKEETMDDRNSVNNGNALSEQLKQNGINESSLLAFLRENPALFDQIKDFSEKSEKTRKNDLTGEGENLNITFSNIKNETEEHQDVSNRREDDRTLRRSNGEEGSRERVDVGESPAYSRGLPISEIRKMSESREEGWQNSADWSSNGGETFPQYEGRADEDLQLERLSDTTENNIPINGGIPSTDGVFSSSDRSLGSETSRTGSNPSDGGEPIGVSQHSRMGVVLPDGRREHSETDLDESSSLDDANIKATDALSIRERVKTILETKRDDEITREDRAILREYEGVGGLKEENTTVEGALSEFYTPTSLAKKVWELVDAYAPDAYTVLEPTCGSGRFLQGRSDNLFTCYECDKTSARIAKILYPNATINNDYFQSQFLSNSKRSLKKNISQSGFGFVKNDSEKYDLVIGNPPYGDARDMFSAFNMYKSNTTYPKYFISEGLLHLKQGGLLAFVVPSSVLDGMEKDLKEFTKTCLLGHRQLNRDIESGHSTIDFWARTLRNNSLVDAYRLPEGIFPSTKVGTDIIILRHESDINPFDLYFSNAPDDSYDTYINRVQKVQNFFTDHPERILGEIKTRKSRYGREETYVDFKEGETKEDVFNRIVPFDSERRERTREVIPPKFAIDEATGEVEKTPVSQKQKTIKLPKVHANSPLAKVMNTDDFLKKYKLNYSENDKEIWKATAYNGSIDTKNLSENALFYLKSSDNYIEIEKDEYYLKALYVVGNIYTKLDDIEKKFGKGYIDRNRYDEVKKLLEDHLPTPLTMDKIHFSPLTEFARNFTVERTFNKDKSYENTKEIPLVNAFYQWAVNTDEELQIYPSHNRFNLATAQIKSEEFYSEKCKIDWDDVIGYINRKPITAGISSTDPKEVKDLKEQKALVTREERKRISENLFDRFLHEGLTEEDRTKLERAYNRIFNAVVEPDYSKIPFFVDGMSTHKGDKEFTLHPIQLRGAAFLQSKGSGLLAYDVGVGKTATGIIATVAQIQSGRAKRPLIVVPKSVYNKWYEDIKQLFPNIDVNNLGNFSDNYLRPFRKGEHGLDIKEGSISLATYESTQNLSFMDSSIENDGLLKEDLVDLLSLTGEGTNRQVASEMQGLYSRYGEAIKTRGENFVYFEECGFDHITLDEAHNFKNLFAIPRKRRDESNEYEGLTGGKPSQRAVKLYCMTSLIQHQNHDRNVFLLTATPFTNHPFEVFTMISFMGRKRMKELQISTLRDFADKFAETKSDYAVTAKGEVEFKQSMKSWRCLRELQSLLFEYIDRVTAEEAGIIRPEKIVHPVFIQMTPLQEKIRDAESDRIVNSDEDAATLKAIGNNKKMSVSPCTLKDEYEFSLPPMTEFVKSSPKLTVTLDTIATLYKENPTCGQVMYCDIAVDYFSLMKQYLIDKGISKDAIASIKGDTSEDRRKSICDAFNDENNPLKILIGSGAIKEGIDLNGNTIALYNISLGWNPSETVQIEGRVWRQGNAQGKVHIVYPLTEDSIDAFIYQKFEEKSKRIDALWSYKGNSLNTEDINPEEMKFDLIKDPEKKAKLFVNDEKEKLKNSLKLIELEKENYKSLKELLETEDRERRNLEGGKNLVRQAKEEHRDEHYIDILKNNIKNHEKEIRHIERAKEKFGIYSVDEAIRVLNEFDEKIANVNNKIATVEQQAAIKLQQYKKEFEEQRKRERKETPEITASLISAIGSNLVKAKAIEEPKTIETTFNESTQSYDSSPGAVGSTPTATTREAPSPKNDNNITNVIENITPVIFSEEKPEIKAESTTVFTPEPTKPQEKPKRSRKAKIVVDDFYSGTLFDFITEEPALLIAKNGFYGQKEIGENLIAKLQKANIPVVEINDKERRFLESSLKAHNSSITDDFHLYGYAENGKIYLSPFGINPETVLHEYTHLWGECIKASNPELFERIKKEVLATDEFKQMLRNDAYENIKSNEDAMCLEVLAILSGDENTERLETLLNPQNGKTSDNDKKIEEALSTTWKFTDEMLFSHHSHNLTLKEITSHILDDAFNSISLEDVKRKYKFQYSELFDENEEFTFNTDKALSQGYAALSHELLDQYFSLRPYMSDETKQHYKDWLSSSIKNDGRQISETLVRYIEEETISQQFFKRFVNDYKDESVKNYIESIFEKNDSENFASAFEGGFTLHSLNFYADRERNQTYLHFANFLHSEVLKEKNPVALNCLKQFISENNSPELIRFLMLTVGAKDQNSYENRVLIRSLLPNVEVKDENNRIHLQQQDFGILDSECFVTSKVYSTLFVGNPLDGKRSKLSLDEKAISLSEEFKSAFSDIDAKRIENSIKDMKAIETESNLSYFDKARRDKALLKGDMEKFKKIDAHIKEKLTTYTYSISNETDFSIESVDSLTNIKDGSLTIPAEILSDFGTIAKNAIKVKTLASEDGNIETLYSSPIKYKDKEYDFTFTLTNENGETVLKEKSLNLSLRDKKKHSLISEEDYIDKDTGEIKSDFIKEIMNGGKSLHEIERERYIDSLYLTRSVNQNIFEGLRKEYLEEKGLAYEPLQDEPTSLLYDEDEEEQELEQEGKQEIDTEKEETIEAEPEIMLDNKENAKEEETMALSQSASTAFNILDDERSDYEDEETDDLDYIDDDAFDYATPSPTPEELKQAFYEEYNKALREDAAFSLVKEREEREAKWAEEKRIAQEEGKKQAVRYYEISKNCSIPVNNPYLLSHGLDASIAEKNGVHYNMKYRQLQIPLYSNKDGELCNIQRIYDDGRKYNLKGAEVGHAVIGEPTQENLVFICEGWATGAAIHKATGGMVYCSMSCINYKRVMDFIRRENSDAFVVAIADRNPPQLGEKYGVGEKYARESGADVTLVIPDTGDPNIKDAADFAKVYDLRDYITNMLVLQKEVITKNNREEKVSSSLTIKPKF